MRLTQCLAGRFRRWDGEADDEGKMEDIRGSFSDRNDGGRPRGTLVAGGEVPNREATAAGLRGRHPVGPGMGGGALDVVESGEGPRRQDKGQRHQDG